MSTNTRVMACRPEDVFGVLNDGWLFPVWVVGASRMRDVDDAWPYEGSHLQHSFGVWPLLINDKTTVLEYDAPRRLVIQPSGWPIGEARVTLEVQPHRKGCLVRITEKAVKGPGALIPAPLLDIPLYMRNHETLRRLAYIAEGKADNGDAPADA
ncbi:SRPBCC family protein [Labedella endophytica]|uniref:SRPBCC family protein n=1 Tax=Labedella endophytica TaxID=1523160 RepID=A0A3S0VIG4_9MICO|nr:SRPBCC family protein [Labedella endophytica]RUR03293.1 SRPBCC family protein [Labedella endophytica]